MTLGGCDTADLACDRLFLGLSVLGDPSPAHAAEHLATTVPAPQLAPATKDRCDRYGVVSEDLEERLWSAALPELLTTPGAFDGIASDGWDWRGSGKAGSFRVRDLGGRRTRLEINWILSCLVAEQLGALEQLAVVHTRRREIAEQVAGQLAASIGFPRERILVGETGSVLAAHAGAGVIGVVALPTVNHQRV